jgi:hypothetical protein
MNQNFLMYHSFLLNLMFRNYLTSRLSHCYHLFLNYLMYLMNPQYLKTHLSLMYHYFPNFLMTQTFLMNQKINPNFLMTPHFPKHL